MNTFKLMTLFSMSVFSCAGFAEQHVLSKNISDADISLNQCVEAAPGLMLLVTPVGEPDIRRYHIKQTLGKNEYIFKSLKNQINQRRILGRKLCNGIVSYSDMDLPFTKSFIENVNDANDGILLVARANEGLGSIKQLLNEMITIAEKATLDCTQTQRADLMTSFSVRMYEIERLTHQTMFSFWYILGTDQIIEVPIHHKKAFVSIPLTNLIPDDNGLNIANLDLSTGTNAFEAVKALAAAIKTTEKASQQFELAYLKLKEAARKDETITSVDLRGKEFITRKK